MFAKPLTLALCAGLLLPAGAIAKQQNHQLTVIAAPNEQAAYERWSDRTAKRLSSSIRRSNVLIGDSGAVGYSRVQFSLDDRGRPQTIALAEPSSSPRINRLSTRAVRSMGSLLPLPSTVPAGSRFEAWIIVANDAGERDDMLQRLQSDHRARVMAQAPGEQPVLIAAR
jgi:CRISPR/Cas system CSM-associated protein Csm3 (group 7 of RAMP superfamily)